ALGDHYRSIGSAILEGETWYLDSSRSGPGSLPPPEPGAFEALLGAVGLPEFLVCLSSRFDAAPPAGLCERRFSRWWATTGRFSGEMRRVCAQFDAVLFLQHCASSHALKL